MGTSAGIIAGRRKMARIAYLRYLCKPNVDYQTEWTRYQEALLSQGTDYYYDYVAGAF
jgi:hypothetical protein